MKPFSVPGFVGAVAIALIATALPSQADLGLDVVPAKYEMQASAGKSDTVPITVRNTSDVPIHILVSLNDYEIGTNGVLRFLDPGKGKLHGVDVRQEKQIFPGNGPEQGASDAVKKRVA